MGKKLLIDATHAEETRVVVVDGNKVEEFDFETIHKRQLAGNIYLAKVTRVEPSLQAAFVDYGGNRHGFLAFAEIHPDYYQIPMADRKALLEEERAYAEAQDEESNGRGRRSRNAPRNEGRSEGRKDTSDDTLNGESAASDDGEGPRTIAAPADNPDAIVTREIAGMDIVDLGEGADDTASTDTTPASDETGTAPRSRGRRRGRGRGAAQDTGNADDAGTADEGRNSDTPDEPEPYRAADHATELDDQIESVADEDVSDEVRPARRSRARRYKIQEVVKVRQIMLVQVVKEERGNKGAALTTYLSLAGRYCVLMPNTARGGGISRKITQAADRKKLKEIAQEIEVPDGAGLIIRTAGANRTKAEIRRDYEYLSRLWEQIRELTLKSIAPAPIYEEGDLIKRSIRDLYSREIDEVLVEGENGFRVAKDFMKMIMPSHARNVKLYVDQMPLFARFQVESYLGAMFNPTVQLKSGGYIVIGITEALVAIDINSGKSTREGSIEETALKTNLEAAEEIARQLRLRDLAGLIVIDFIDMEERKNNAAVEKRLKDKLKNDRARIQVGRISGFGLLEMSRQRLRPGMLEATTQPCPHCHGTGLIRSDNSLALTILRALEEEGTRNRSREVLVKAPIGIVNYLFNAKREHLAQIELRYGMAIRLEADPTLISPDFSIEKFKTATRIVAPAPVAVVSFNAQTMSDIDDEFGEEEEDEVEAIAAPETEADAGPEAVAAAPASADAGDNGDGGRKKRRRRRRRRGGAENGSDEQGAMSSDEEDDGPASEGDAAPAVQAAPTQAPTQASEAPVAAVAASDAVRADAAPVAGAVVEGAAEGTGEEAGEKPARKRRTRRKPAKADEADASSAEAAAPAETVSAAPAEAEAAPAPKRRRSRKSAAPAADVQTETPLAATSPAPSPASEAASEAAPEAPQPEPEPQVALPGSAPAGATAPLAEPLTEADGPAPQADSTGDVPADVPVEPAVAQEPEASDSAEDSAQDTGRTELAAGEQSATDSADDPGTDPDKPRRRGWWSLGR